MSTVVIEILQGVVTQTVLDGPLNKN